MFSHPTRPQMEIESPVILERAMGIGPTYSAWKAAALPLCYARISLSYLGEVLGLYTSFYALSRGVYFPLKKT